MLAIAPPLAARPPEECRTITWDVSRELDLLASAATPVVLGARREDAPEVVPGRVYEATLLPQSTVASSAAPRPTEAGGHAGIARIRVDAPGRHRVSASGLYRIDVVVDGERRPALAFQGSPACPFLRKIVEFDLPAGRDFYLELTDVSALRTRFVVTVAPASD